MTLSGTCASKNVLSKNELKEIIDIKKKQIEIIFTVFTQMNPLVAKKRVAPNVASKPVTPDVA